MCRQKRFGKIKTFTASNCQTVKAPNIRLSGPLGGGPVGDVGVYLRQCGSLHHRERADPGDRCSGQPEEDPRFREVPESVSFLLRYPSGVVAARECSFGTARSSSYQVLCEDGSIQMNPALQLLRPATFNHQSERWHSKPHGTFHRADRSIRRRDGCVFTVCPAENAGSNSRRSGPAGYAN